MYKRFWLIMALFLFALFALNSFRTDTDDDTSLPEAALNEDGLRVWNSALAYKALTLYSKPSGEGEDGEVYLIDIEGNKVHSWDAQLTGDVKVALFEDSTLLLARNLEDGAIIQELDWDGNVIWDWSNSAFHHDMAKMPNGNYLLPLIELSEDNKAWNDSIAQIDYKSKEVLWKWRFTKEEAHINSVEYIEFQGDPSMLLSSKDMRSVFIVNLESGEIVWEFSEGLVLPEDIFPLKNGNVLIVNNVNQNSAEILEINPNINEIVWRYGLPAKDKVYVVGVQALLNGDVFISEVDGTLLEVNQLGEVVWEYGADSKGKAYRYGPLDVKWRADFIADMEWESFLNPLPPLNFGDPGP